MITYVDGQVVRPGELRFAYALQIWVRWDGRTWRCEGVGAGCDPELGGTWRKGARIDQEQVRGAQIH